MTAEQQNGLGRLERLNWPGIALAAVAALIVIFFAVGIGMSGPGLLERLAAEPPIEPTQGQFVVLPETPDQAAIGGPVPTFTATSVATLPSTATSGPPTAG